MRRSTASSRWIRFGVAALVAFATSRLAEASCSAGPEFGQLLPSCGGGYCYVVSPGSHTPQSLAGSFWSFGSGNPAIGPGNDSGAWPVGSWLVAYGSSLYFGGAWHTSPAIDGCITGSVAPGKPAEIMVAMFSDEGEPNRGFFALASARRFANSFPEFDFTFAAGGALPRNIDLVDIPKARVASSTREGVIEFIAPSLEQVTTGIYGDASVAAVELIEGYRVYTRTTSPSSNRTSAGWSDITGLVPLGQNAVVTVPPGGDRWFGYTLVFEGDFETAHLGQLVRSTSLCHPTDADGDGFSDLLGDPECCPDGLACDCNDADVSVHPGALEVCNGIDDDCNAAIDDVALPGSVALNQFQKKPGTTGLGWPPLVVATSYDVVRGDLTTRWTPLPDSDFGISSAPRIVPGSEATTPRTGRRSPRATPGSPHRATPARRRRSRRCDLPPPIRGMVKVSSACKSLGSLGAKTRNLATERRWHRVCHFRRVKLDFRILESKAIGRARRRFS